jgi:hypothetical protein
MLGRPRGCLVALWLTNIISNTHIILSFLFLHPAPFPLDDAATRVLVDAWEWYITSIPCYTFITKRLRQGTPSVISYQLFTSMPGLKRPRGYSWAHGKMPSLGKFYLYLGFYHIPDAATRSLVDAWIKNIGPKIVSPAFLSLPTIQMKRKGRLEFVLTLLY